MEDKRKNCPLRHKSNGNCLPCGGFCTAVNDAICEAIHQAYDHGFGDGYRKAKADASWDTPAFFIGTDYEMPILKGEDRKYVDDEVCFTEEE